MYRPAQIARACGRVSVGADPDKRPVKRREKTGSRRRTGEPRLNGGSRLKATTDRAFLVSVGPSKGRRTEEACLSCRACGRVSFQTMATLTATQRLRTPSRNLEALTRFGENVSLTAHHPIGRAGACLADAGPGCGSTACSAFPSRGQDTGRSHEADWYGAGDRALRRGGGDDRPYLGIPPGATRSRT